MFNTLKYAKLLEEAGYSRVQAETSIRILVEIMEDKLATKQDVYELKQEIRHDIVELRSGTQQDLLQLKHDLTLKLGAMLSAAIAIVAAIHRFT